MIRLFTTWYSEPNAVRRAEYVECLRRNLACSAVDEVCVLAEGSDPTLAPSARLRIRRVEKRPDYANYFDWINCLASADDVSVIANSDIYYDAGLGVLERWHIPSRSVLALSRWEVGEDGVSRLYDRNDSQDTWIFRGAVEGVRGDFPIGVPRCDNRIAKELELAGYSVRNPSFSLRSFHLHAGKREPYRVLPEAGFVEPPYGYVWPHNLLPFHKTLWRNAFHSGPRIGWRFDTRLWRRKLKLHRIEKALGVRDASSTRTTDSL